MVPLTLSAPNVTRVSSSFSIPVTLPNARTPTIPFIIHFHNKICLVSPRGMSLRGPPQGTFLGDPPGDPPRLPSPLTDYILYLNVPQTNKMNAFPVFQAAKPALEIPRPSALLV